MSLSVFILISVFLLFLGIIASLTPGVPAGIFSLSGVLLYWWSTGYSSPGTVALFIMALISFLVIVLDIIASFFGAKIGGSDNKTAIKATLVGILLFFVLGPLGILVGIIGSIFLMEFFKTGDRQKSLNTALYTGLAVLTSSVMKVILTSTVLIIFLISVYI